MEREVKGRTVLGVDLGRKRIGLAVSDETGTVALPIGALESQGMERDVAAVHELARERCADEVVVGLPIHMDGREGPAARAAQRFAIRLAEVSGLRVETLDERWTSVAAERALAEGGLRGRDRRGRVDAVAATLLLRTFLERRRAGAGGR
jgi:putative holliday junction resolvase